MNDSISARAICPFFRRAEKQFVRCEGMEPGQRVEIGFRSKSKHKGWLDRYCCSYNFGCCPLYRALEQNCKET